MSATITVPGSPRTMYVQLRERGDEHGKAAEKVAHAFSRAVIDMAWLPNARDEGEGAGSAPAEPEPPAPAPEPAEPDLFAEKEAEARAAIVTLTDRRASLALDALNEP